MTHWPTDRAEDSRIPPALPRAFEEAAGRRSRTDSADRPGAWTWIWAVVLPAFTLGFEIVTGFCAALSFDPLPTMWHVPLVAAVPVVNAWTILALRRRDPRHVQALAGWNSLALGMCLAYTIVFIPLTPLAIPAIAVMGLGLVALSPLISWWATARLRGRLRKLAAGQPDGSPLPAAWKGMALGVGMLVLLGLPSLITLAGFRMATGEPARRAEGIRWLRDYGDPDLLLGWCFRVDRPLAPMGLVRGALQAMKLNIPGTREIDPAQAQQVFYRVTGNLYNAVEPPPLRGLRGGFIGPVTRPM